MRSTLRSQSPWGSRLPDPYFDRSDKIYELALKKDQVSPFQPPDELHPAKPDTPKPAEKASDKASDKIGAEAAEKPKIEKIDIDLDGIAARIQEVPVTPGNYEALQVADGKLCWIDVDRTDRQKNSLQCVAIANKGDKPETLAGRSPGL